MYRNLIIVLSAFVSTIAFEGCAGNQSKMHSSPKGYDLNKPSFLYLSDALAEISGIYFYPKDSGVFAISDESGYLYKIQFNNNFITQRWKFDKTHDFEDLYYRNNAFYILESNGNIHTIQFSQRGDTITTQTSIFPADKKDQNEFESLYYDSTRKSFVMICKDCKSDKKNVVSAWGYDPENNSFTPSVFTINVDSIFAKTGGKKVKFKPSGAAINPLTGDLWIISAVNMLLVVADQNGNFKEAYQLNSSIFTQPEGITFTPFGDLIISDEAGNKYNPASLLIFKIEKN